MRLFPPKERSVSRGSEPKSRVTHLKLKSSNSNEDQQDTIPLTSLEAFEILKQDNAVIELTSLVFHFQQLIDLKNSVLVDLSRSSDLKHENSQFIKNLTDLSHRLFNAINNNTPYPTLFGDLLNLKTQLQIVSLYYQEELRLGQPIAQAFTDNIKRNYAHCFDQEHSDILSSEDEDLLVKYTINYCADSIMKLDIPRISQFILKAHLEDHSATKEFSYLSPSR